MRRGALVLAGGSATLLLALFLDWFALDFGDERIGEGARALAARLETDLAITGWETYNGLDIALALAAVAGLTAGVAALRGVVVPEPVTFGAAVFAAIVVLGRVVDPPGDGSALTREPGLWLALVAATTMLAGAGATRSR